jgi:hypothetical protein
MRPPQPKGYGPGLLAEYSLSIGSNALLKASRLEIIQALISTNLSAGSLMLPEPNTAMRADFAWSSLSHSMD